MTVVIQSIPQYLAYHLVFTIPLILILFWLGRATLNRIDALGVSIHIPVAVLYAAPWDSYLIGHGVWRYGSETVLVRIWNVPLGEYLFFGLQTLLTGLIVSFFSTADGRSGHQTVRARVIGLAGGVSVGLIGLLLVIQSNSTVYLGAILLWAGPVLAIQWAYDWQYLWERRRIVGLAVLVPTLYLTATDLVAISMGLWQISAQYTIGLRLLHMPVEEAVFFATTNIFVVQGLILFRGLVEWEPVHDRLTDYIDISPDFQPGSQSHGKIEQSKRIQQRTGKTFHVATRLFPKRIRRATYVLYAFFRIADEVVDDSNPGTAAHQRQRLEAIREAAKGDSDTDDPVLLAFNEIRESSGIPDREIDEFIDAMVADIETRHYESREDLEKYMRGSAVAVAYMMVAIMAPEKAAKAKPHAAALGNAFQMTNFLRDVREDIVEYDRIYLPATVRESYGVTEAQIREREFTDRFASLIEDELHRVEGRYRKGVAGIKYLPDCCQFAVTLAAVLYADHHRLIRNCGFDTLSKTPELSMLRRLTLTVRAWIVWMLTKDPERIFYRVSVVSRNQNQNLNQTQAQAQERDRDRDRTQDSGTATAPGSPGRDDTAADSP